MYNLKGSPLEKWVCTSDDHQDAPVDRAPSADEEAAAPQETPRKPEGVSD